MIKDNQEYNMGVKSNSAFERELREKLPAFFNREGFDIDKFQEALRENNVNEFSEGYQLNFIGKDYARKQAGDAPTTVIVPDNEHNEKAENKNSKNLFFTGDNLEVLRHLRNVYSNKIDVIYIDPPYNTGNDGFVYPDQFDYSNQQLEEIFGMSEKDIEKLDHLKNSKSHSAWLTFMYPRLWLAKQLLSEDGVIFISIDDNEQANLKELCDEIFGEQNFISNIVQKSRTGISNDKIISNNHNLLLFYAKNKIIIDKERDKFGIKRNESDFKSYTKNDNDGKGLYTLNPVTGPGGARKGNPYYEFLGVENYWRFSKEKMSEMYTNGLIVKHNNNLYQKTYKADLLNKKKGASTWWESVGTTSHGSKELKEYFDDIVFDFPKPTSLIKYILNFIDMKKGYILDFFAGSATTADAVMQLNAEDGGQRQFIMVQLPEPTYEVDKDGNKKPTKGGKAAFEAGYMSIDEISRERIKRAAKKIKEENPNLSDDFDGGFKHYRVVSPNVTTLDEIDKFDPEEDKLFNDMISPFSSHELQIAGNASGEDTILTTWLVQDGYGFNCEELVEYDFAGYKAYGIEDTRLYLIDGSWSTEQTEVLINQLGNGRLNFKSVVVYGYSFNMPDLKELELALTQLNTKVNLIKRY